MENPTAELAAMEKRWNDRIAKQKEIINRLMANRQRVLDILNTQMASGESLTQQKCKDVSDEIREALDHE